MTITFLGTGTSQGVPVIGCTCSVCRSVDFKDKRLRTSIAIEVENLSLVVDTGPDFRQQMLRERIRKLDAILFTHAHRDHTAGLDDIRAYNYIQDMAMPLYGTENVLSQLKAEFSYAFAEDYYPGTPRLQPHAITDQPFFIGEIKVQPLPVMHLHLPVFGFRIRNFSYITDANFIPDSTFELLKGTETLVLNALQLEPHISHFNLEQALEQIARINPARTYLTHISHKLGSHQLVQGKLPAGVSLAWDGLQITL